MVNLAPGSARPRAAGTFELLTGLMLVLLFTISAMLLFQLGIHYESPGGSVLHKIHPATFLAVFTLGFFILRHSHPVVYANDLMKQHKGTLIFLLGWCLLLAYLIFVQKQPFTPLIDTFLMPVFVFLILLQLGEDSRHHLALLLHGLMFLNAAIGYYEFLSGDRLIPLMAGDLLLKDEWRSSALFGHPLMNASLTGSYLLILAFGGGKDLPVLSRPLIMVMTLGALVVFGGRASLVLSLLIIVLLGLAKVMALASGSRFGLGGAILVVAAVPVLALVGLVLLEAGFFDQLIGRFVNDKGSTVARFAMFDLFHVLNMRDILFGPDPGVIATEMKLQGLVGIESFWIAFVLSYGLIISCVFFAGLFFFLADVASEVRASGVLIIIYYMLVASTSVSLSAKITNFGMFLALLLVMMPRVRTLWVAPAAGDPEFAGGQQGNGSYWV